MRSLLATLVLPLGLLTPATAQTTSASASDLLMGGQYLAAYEQAQKAGDLQTASTAAFAQALFRTPKDPAALDRAIAAGQAAVNAQPRVPQLRLNLAGAYGLKANQSGVSLRAVQLARSARSELENLVKLYPDFAEGYASLAHWHASAYAKAGMLSGGRPEVAKQLAAKALSLDPKALNVNVEVALAYVALKDPAKARAALQVALKQPVHSAMQKDRQAQAQQLLDSLR